MQKMGTQVTTKPLSYFYLIANVFLISLIHFIKEPILFVFMFIAFVGFFKSLSYIHLTAYFRGPHCFGKWPAYNSQAGPLAKLKISQQSEVQPQYDLNKVKDSTIRAK